MSAPPHTAVDRLALPLLAAIFAAGWFLVGAWRSAPLIDDWVYAWSVEHFLKTGELRVLGYSGLYPLAQILWGASFAAALGFSFAALRLSTVCLSILGCWAWYLTLRELGCDFRARVLATLVLVFNPVYFALSYSFMTDVPFVNLSNLAVYFIVSAARREAPRRLWLGGLCAVAAFLVRPLGIAISIAALVAVPWRRAGLAIAREWLAPLACALGAMAVLWVVTNRTMGQAEWATTRLENLRWWTSISLRTYAGWNVHLFCEAAFPLAPAFLAAALSRRETVVRSAVIGMTFAIVLRLALGEVPTGLPDWQTWSLQDIGARAMLAGSASASAWSAHVMPWLRGVTMVVLAAVAIAVARLRHLDADNRRAAGVPLALAVLLFVLINALWLYNDRYYIVFAPALAYLATRLGPMRPSIAGALLSLWAIVAVTGARDMIGVADTSGAIARRLEAAGARPWEVDAGYAWDGWRLYAHPENLAPGGDPKTDVPFVTSDEETLYTIATSPQPGYDTIEIVPLAHATWQATKTLYLLKRKQ